MPFMKAFSGADRFGFSTIYGDAWFTIEGDYCVLERVSGVYEKQHTEDRNDETLFEAVHTLENHFDDPVYPVMGEDVPIHCPEVFIVGRGRISGIRVHIIPHEFYEEAGTINVPTRYLSPGAMAWPVEWLVIKAENGCWITHYQVLLSEYRVDRLVDKNKELHVNITRDKVVRLE